ncbi:MAG: NAD-dependent epimerase/dehydratase family protein [Planctomycetes bacterium]|nr:NAD-dependent epimerase/dehydratase family protein [Planctomycetota bacterium]
MRILVTGVGGFLGGAVVREALARGHEVRSVSRGAYPDLDSLGVASFQADLAQAGAELDAALQHVDCVIHCAAKAGVSGKREPYLRANHQGTVNLLAAAKGAGVTRFVHTSSPSVCFDGKDHVRAGNDLPHAARFLAPYPESKSLAEKAVLAAHDGGAFHACALRPHLIFGPGDPHLLPKLLDRARRGKLIQVGPGTNEVSLTFVENAALAHVLAAERLEPGAAIGGKAYFLSQTEPVNLWDWIRTVLQALDMPPVRRRISLGFAYRLGAFFEGLYALTRKSGDPPMSRFIAQQLATSHSYDMTQLARDLGYTERVSLAEATDRAVADLRARFSAR